MEPNQKTTTKTNNPAVAQIKGTLHRMATVVRSDEESRTIELSFSSEEPYERWFGVEILDHGAKSVNMEWLSSGNAPLLANHDMRNQIGVIESAKIDNKRGTATVRFSRAAEAEQYFADVLDGIRKNISVGYEVIRMVLEEDGEDTPPVYRVTEWRPLEISLVSIPADQSVGIGRNAGGDTELINLQPITQETKAMDPKQTPQNVDTGSAPAVDVNSITQNTRDAELKRMREISAIGELHNCEEAAAGFISDGKSVEEFRAHVLETIGKKKVVKATRDDTELGLTDKEAREFSFLNALRAQVVGNWNGAEFEREVIQQTMKKFEREFEGQIVVPTEVLTAKRDLSVGTPTAGGYLVDSDMRPQSFIEILQNKMVLRRLGATVLTGLQGNLEIPAQTGGSTAYWLTEGSDATESEATFGQKALTPKTVGAYTELTRKLLLQSSIDMENFVRNELARVLSLEVDRAGLKGSGAGAEPLGILNVTGIGSVTITTGTYTWAKVVDLESEVAVDNADLGALAYVTSATDRGIMKKTEKATNTAQFIYSNMIGQPGVGEINGYPAHATNQLAADETIFGNWADLIIGEWGFLDVLVNPYAKDTSGGVRITAMQDVDVVVRHAESFARTTT